MCSMWFFERRPSGDPGRPARAQSFPVFGRNQPFSAIATINNRFARGCGRCTLVLFVLAALACARSVPAAEFFVSPAGSDENPGTLEQPFASPHHAQRAARQIEGEPVTVYLRGGTYYLNKPLVFTPQDSGKPTAPVVYRAYKNEQPVLSGGMRLQLDWRPYRNGIMQARLPQRLATDQLFVNGRRWHDPAGAFFHALHRACWGDLHYLVTGKDAQGNLTYEGGWQNNRPSAPHGEYRFVENVFEELDAPGEWFYDPKQQTLYFYPPKGLDLNKAIVEGVRLEQIVEFRGNQDRPVRWVELCGLKLVHAARTFMKNKEPLLRSDWTIWRGGAVYLERAEDCRLRDLDIDQVGSNAIFLSGYNRRIEITGCRISRAGASGICFVGLPEAVRSPLFQYGQTQTLEEMDHAPGPGGSRNKLRASTSPLPLRSPSAIAASTACPGRGSTFAPAYSAVM